MQRTADAAEIFWFRFTEMDSFVLKFASELRALLRIRTEERFQFGIFHGLRRLFVSLLPVLRNDFFILTHI